MFHFRGVFHESSVRASSFIWRVILSFLKLLVTSISSPPNGKILSVEAPYKGMSSFQRGKDNNRVEMLLYLKIGIAKVCSKFDGVYYLIMNVIAVFMENIHCGAASSAQFHASMWRRMI